MSLAINANKWRFLNPDRARDYIAVYERVRPEGVRGKGWKELAPATTKRQFATAREILNRMNSGQRGVLLADDVGLGKTTVATLCALVFAGAGKRVRILAPNEMMSRRWRQEVQVHVNAIQAFAPHLDLSIAQRRANQNIQRLNPGAIAVSTHYKAGQLSCDLLIVDEAHRTRSDGSSFAHRMKQQDNGIGHIIVLTATPFSIDPGDLSRLLARGGGSDAEKPMKVYCKLLHDLWRGRISGQPKDAADQLVAAADAAVKAMQPYVIRHSIEGLNKEEQQAFGQLEEGIGRPPLDVPDDVFEVMLRTDRALALARTCGMWDMTRTNDPRHHVALGQLRNDLSAVTVKATARTAEFQAAVALHHAQAAGKKLGTVRRHPKIADTVAAVQDILNEGEKALVFCDHVLPATELAAALAEDIAWLDAAGGASNVARDAVREAWRRVILEERNPKNTANAPVDKRLAHYLDWLTSEGIWAQVSNWLSAELRPGLTVELLIDLLESVPARKHSSCYSIAEHARQLYGQLIDPESGSTRTLLARGKTVLPGSTRIQIAAVCDANVSTLNRHPGVFYPKQPDLVLATFNSAFGPEVLIATDRLSEGVDLHRFCRHLIHHELDPSPVRTVQRNGRLRRVNSWAARCKEPIRIQYPALKGTRDERLVEIMRHRLLQFDILLGGVGVEIIPEDVNGSFTTAKDILDYARTKLRAMRLDRL